MFQATAKLFVEAKCVKFPPFSEDTQVISIARTFNQQSFGQIGNLLEIPVPSGQSQVFIEHRDAIDHVLEGNPQFGLALADFVQ